MPLSSEGEISSAARGVERWPVTLPTGETEVSIASQRPTAAWATLVLAHGAGAGFDHPFLVGFAEALAHAGIATVRFNFAYREAGRRMPGPASHAIATWRAVVDRARGEAPAGEPVWAAGKSYGGRLASVTEAERPLGIAGLVYLGYPLHPPGDPTKERAEHLPRIAVPQLFVEGTNDPFVVPHEGLERAVSTCQDAQLTWIEGGGHSFEVKGQKRPADEVGAALAPLVADFLRARQL
ncbi:MULTISPECIES: alpha/beta hydrolase family protein [Bacteria]